MIQIERDEDGDLVVRGISPLHADTLLQIPLWLVSDDPRVRSRLLPIVYDDPADEKQWRQFGAPELEHLFASRAELVGKDLASLEPDDAVTYRMTIRSVHASAWLSSLNAARLALFELYDLADEDMEREPASLNDFEKELALVRIHIMALMQELLLESGAT